MARSKQSVQYVAPDASAESVEIEPAKTKAGRKPGRPSSGEKGGVTRQGILQAALKLSRTVALQDLSVVIVARAIDVTPALIHYYIGGRDWLTSGIMNRFYKNLLKKWPDETGEWQTDIKQAANVLFESLKTFPGIAAYLVSNNRFRVFQLTAFGDRDFGLEVLERFTGCVKSAGLSAERTGIYTHLMMDFVVNTAHGASHHLFPSEHRQFLESKLASLAPGKYPNIEFAKVAPLQLDGDFAFQEGIELFLLGLQRDRDVKGVGSV